MLVGTFLLSACASDQYYVRLDDSVHKLEQRVGTIERQQEEEAHRGAGDLQKQLADTTFRLDSLETELRMLNASVEETRLGPRDLPAVETRELELFYERVEARLQQLEQKVAACTAAPPAVTPAAGALPDVPAPTDASRLQASSPAEPTPPATPAAPAPPSARERAFYEDAYTVYKRGDYDAARKKLVKFTEAFPQSQYKVNALFWIAECSYQEKNYEEAIIKYDEIITTYPDHPKASSALLKQGFSFLMIGDQTDGALILKKVIERYPDSDQAEIARRKLDTLR
ncbi:MAG: tol-pal system protein YbgF [Deltaproteobacteria bacterium]|nr:tol-pal system protein YbgF [Candidatus Anaeroferrophillacea bacterium]